MKTNPEFSIVSDDRVQCTLCPHFCRLKAGQHGVCHVRWNNDGQMELKESVSSIVIDTIRKRPIYLYKTENHKSLSIGNLGCNNKCPFCQNYMISQSNEFDFAKYKEPREIIELAKKHEVGFISFSFNEVIVNFEFFENVANLAKINKIKICVKTAGYISEQWMDRFLELIDVMNVDIKPLDDDFLKKCGVYKPDVVHKLIYRAIEKGIHIEVSHIVIEGVNDSLKAMHNLCLALWDHFDIGVHLLRHYPAWKSDYPITKDKTLSHFRDYLLSYGFKNIYMDDVG